MEWRIYGETKSLQVGKFPGSQISCWKLPGQLAYRHRDLWLKLRGKSIKSENSLDCGDMKQTENDQKKNKNKTKQNTKPVCSHNQSKPHNHPEYPECPGKDSAISRILPAPCSGNLSSRKDEPSPAVTRNISPGAFCIWFCFQNNNFLLITNCVCASCKMLGKWKHDKLRSFMISLPRKVNFKLSNVYIPSTEIFTKYGS